MRDRPLETQPGMLRQSTAAQTPLGKRRLSSCVHRVMCCLSVVVCAVVPTRSHAQVITPAEPQAVPGAAAPAAMAVGTTNTSPPTSPVASALSVGDASLSGSDETELARLDGTLRELAVGQKSYRLWGGLSALALGALSVPAGIVIARRDNGLAFAGVVMAAVGAGEVVAGTLLLTLPFGPLNSFEPLTDSIQEQRRVGRPPRAIISAIESDWEKRSNDARSQRHTMAWLTGAVGVLSMSAGTYLALEPVSRWTRSQQIAFSSVYFAAGSLAIIGSLQTYFLESPIETAWISYRGRKAPPTVPQRQSRIDIAPMPGGAMLQVGVRF